MSLALYLAHGAPVTMTKPTFTRPTTVARLEQWAVHANPYAAPETEAGRIYLSGKVYGYPGRPDGDTVSTGHIYEVEGTIAYSKRTAYQLGEPSRDYLAWLAEKGIAFDSATPIRLVK